MTEGRHLVHSSVLGARIAVTGKIKLDSFLTP